MFENGDVRCNRTAYGFVVGRRWHPVLDGDDPRDRAARGAIFRYFAGIGFAATRAGVGPLLRHGARPVTFVMHRFMDATDVAPAWKLTQRGVTSDDPRLRETQERLAGCHYSMAHPETGTLVPACVQHSVLDPAENARLAVALPMPTVRRSR